MTKRPRGRGTAPWRRGGRPWRTTRAAAGLALGAVLATAASLASCEVGGGEEGVGPGPDAGKRQAGQAGEGASPFTLVATGDLIPYPSIMEQARRDADGRGYDFTRILRGVRPVVAGADLAVCHLETPFGETGGPFSGYPTFVSPPQLAKGLKATGYDSCSTASNHALDAGVEGVERTLGAMDAVGLGHVGSARSREEGERPAVLEAGGARVAQLSYTYGTNGIPVPEGRPWLVDLIDPGRVVADARAARRAGADVVVVSVHWGTEWRREPDERQRELAQRLTRSRSGGRRDIDLIVGTHNHVPQPYEKVNGTWVVYGLGDLMASFIPSMYRGNEGSIARFTFSPPDRGGAAWKVSRAEFLVGHSDTGPPFRVVRASAEDHPEVHARVREAVLSRGAAEDGLREAG